MYCTHNASNYVHPLRSLSVRCFIYSVICFVASSAAAAVKSTVSTSGARTSRPSWATLPASFDALPSSLTALADTSLRDLYSSSRSSVFLSASRSLFDYSASLLLSPALLHHIQNWRVAITFNFEYKILVQNNIYAYTFAN